MSKRNLVRQVIINKDGTEKVLFHPKKFNAPQYGSHLYWWRTLCRTANPKSKRQKKLAEEANESDD